MAGFADGNVLATGIQQNIVGEWRGTQQLHTNGVSDHVSQRQTHLGVIVHLYPGTTDGGQCRIKKVATHIRVHIDAAQPHNHVSGLIRHQRPGHQHTG